MPDRHLDPELQTALTSLARTPTLLVACDYDGVVAPIVSDPSRAFPLPESVRVLIDLAVLPATSVALVSGRARADLADLSGLPSEIHLVGSHGAEFATGFVLPLTGEQLGLHTRLGSELERLITGVEGVLLESKPASIAVHVRNASAKDGERVLAAVADGPARWPGIEATAGKKVLELAVISASKGTALDALRDSLNASAVFFVGDDVTDEKAFAQLRDGDVGVKVGPGENLAQYRVADPLEVTDLLAFLLRARREGFPAVAVGGAGG